MCGCVSQHAPGLTFLSPENMTLSDPTDPVWQGMGGGGGGGRHDKEPGSSVTYQQVLSGPPDMMIRMSTGCWNTEVRVPPGHVSNVVIFSFIFHGSKNNKDKQTNKPTRWAEEENNFNCVYLYSGSAAAVQSVKAALVPSRGLYIIFQHEKYKYSVYMISSPFSCVYFHLVCCCYNFRFATTHAPENETGENSQAVVKNTHAAILLQS